MSDLLSGKDRKRSDTLSDLSSDKGRKWSDTVSDLSSDLLSDSRCFSAGEDRKLSDAKSSEVRRLVSSEEKGNVFELICVGKTEIEAVGACVGDEVGVGATLVGSREGSLSVGVGALPSTGNERQIGEITLTLSVGVIFFIKNCLMARKILISRNLK